MHEQIVACHQIAVDSIHTACLCLCSQTSELLTYVKPLDIAQQHLVLVLQLH